MASLKERRVFEEGQSSFDERQLSIDLSIRKFILKINLKKNGLSKTEGS